MSMRYLVLMAFGVIAAGMSVESSIAQDYTCISGYVWREARASDLVCVPPQTRSRTKADNAAAPGRWDPNGYLGRYTCKSGYVWREAFAGDAVCVTPARRSAVARENAEAALHRTRG